jgi:hypothetical protein
VQRIVNSKTFQSAPALQQLLRFLATRALEEPTDEIKEYTISAEALGRKPDFDPKTDPIVRVQVYRFRRKLKEYYELEGAQESILVEIPKGHYLPGPDTRTGILACTRSPLSARMNAGRSSSSPISSMPSTL